MTFLKRIKWKNPLGFITKLTSKVKDNYSKTIKKELKIFYVEDEVYYLKLMNANLTKMGFVDTQGFSSGEELLLHLEGGNRPDVIIMDYIIKGGMDAFETLTEIKKYELDCNIIILSGQSGVDKAAMIIKNGASDYIVKNNMAFFNLENCLMKIKKAFYTKLETEIKTRRTRTVYQLGILFIWVVLVFVLFSKMNFGIF